MMGLAEPHHFARYLVVRTEALKFRNRRSSFCLGFGFNLKKKFIELGHGILSFDRC
jgi:hypothetical protein